MANPVPEWFGFVDGDGRIKLEVANGFTAYKRAFINKRIVLTLKPWYKKATRKQHGWYRGVALPMIAEEMGHREYEYPAVHDALMRELFGLKEGCDPRLKIRRSTADMNTQDFTEMMMSTVQEWAATKLGLVIPDPDPEWAFRKKRKTEAA